MEYETYDYDSSIENLRRYIRRLNNKIHDLYEIVYKQNVKEREGIKNKFSYCIDKETFISCMTAIKKLDDWIGTLEAVNIRLDDNHPIYEVQSTFSDLVSKCVNDPTNVPYIYSDLSYFMFDLDWGKKYESGMVKDSDGKEIDFSDLNHLWNYFISDKNITNETRIKNLSTRELAEYVYSVYLTGIAKAHGKVDDFSLVDYEKWLKEEVTK